MASDPSRAAAGFDLLHPVLQHHIVNSLGWRDLRPLQRDAVAPIMAGEHVLALAPTAGGKTEAAMLPVLSQILSEPRRGLSTLYLCPLRALLNNLHQRLETYGAFCGLDVGLRHGDTSSADRRALIDAPPEVLLTTPESLEAMLISAKTDHRRMFANLRTVIVDEVHAFGGDDRGWHLLGVLERLGDLAAEPVQRIGLSATVGDPEALLGWLVGSSTAARRVIAPDVTPQVRSPSKAVPAEQEPSLPPTIPTEITVDHVGHLPNAAVVISKLHPGEKRLVFCDSRSSVEQLAAELRKQDVTTFVSHASLALDERRRAEEAFASGRDCVIVATSTLELGLDVGDLDRVIQINSTITVASFLQRLGRTGRRPGSVRNMLFLTTGNGHLLVRTAAMLHLWAQGYVEPVTPPPLPLHLLAHQLLAYVIQEGRVGRSLWQRVIGRLPVYAEAIDTGDADVIVDYLVDTGMLFEDEGMLSIGPEGEHSYGFRHFIDLTGSFTSPPGFVARHGKDELGVLDAASLLTNEGYYETVLLGGRSWKINSIDWNRQAVWVEPATTQGRSRWYGSGQALSVELCNAVRQVAAGTDPAGVTFTQRAQEVLADMRTELGFARPGHTSVVIDERSARWWTWAGLRANNSLVDALGDLVTSRGDDLSIGLGPGHASHDEITGRLAELHPDTLPTPSVAGEYAANLKFADCLPEAMALEVARQRLIDPPGVARVLKELG